MVFCATETLNDVVADALRALPKRQKRCAPGRKFLSSRRVLMRWFSSKIVTVVPPLHEPAATSSVHVPRGSSSTNAKCRYVPSSRSTSGNDENATPLLETATCASCGARRAGVTHVILPASTYVAGTSSTSPDGAENRTVKPPPRRNPPP